MKLLNFSNNNINLALPSNYKWSKDILFFSDNEMSYFYFTLERKIVKFLPLVNLYEKILIDNKKILKTLKKLSIIKKNNLLDLFSNPNKKNDYLEKVKDIQKNEKIVRKNITFASTLKCNFSCHYCFENKNGKTITTENLEYLSNYIIENYKNDNIPYDITWYGGEPLLKLDIIKKVSEQLNLNKVNYASEVLTNGYHLNDEACSLLSKINLRHIQVSIDGPEKFHNTTRFTVKNSLNKIGSYKEIIHNIKNALIVYKLPLILRVNCHPENINEIQELINCPDFSQLPKNCFKIYFGQIDSKNPDNLYFKIIKLNEYFCKMGYNVMYNKTNDLKIFSCSAIKDQDLCIGPDLELYECYSDFGHKNKVIGNLKNISKKNIKKEFYKNIILPIKCKECEVLPICFSQGCPFKTCNNYLIQSEHYCINKKNDILDLLLKFV